jgi:rhamnulose-1-phosphate aldolase/alcohol dehydrogenase
MPLRRIESRWNPAEVPSDLVDQLVYASNLLGSDPGITNFGGGNTSSKVDATDPLTGEDVTVLWVKASGGDLGSAKRSGFASLYLGKLLSIEAAYQAGRLHEDEAVPLYAASAFGGNPAAPSIDTPLHGYVDAPCVSHMHSDAVIAIAAAADGERLTREIYGDRLGWLPWKRPGLELGLMLRDLQRDNPKVIGAMMGSHGFICWGDTWEETYRLTLDLINEAVDYINAREKQPPFGVETARKTKTAPDDVLTQLLPILRGRVAHEGKRLIASIDRSPAVLEFMAGQKFGDLAAMGTSCPDHFLRTKIRPMVLDPEASIAELDASLHHFRSEYRNYYDRCRQPDSPAIRNPNPSIILIPGVGMVAFNKNAKEARVTGEFYRNAIEVMRGAETVSRYTALPEQEAFNIEYWQLEEAKLRRLPAEKEMARRIVLVVGAGPGMGAAVSRRLLDQDATVFLADRSEELVRQSVSSLAHTYGADNVDGATCDITDRASVRTLLQKVVLRYGGLDAVVNLAAVFFAPDLQGNLEDDKWRKTMEVNALGSQILAEEAAAILRAQQLPASIVLVSSANAVVAKRGSLAYDLSKAAVNHLVRELAVELAPIVRVNAVAPATVVAGSQMFPRDRVLSSLAKYGLSYQDAMTDEELRTVLADFYAQRTLLKQPVSPEKVADALYLLCTDRLAQTTGHILPVDAGLTEAFLR